MIFIGKFLKLMTLTKTRALKQAMMQELLTGRTRLVGIGRAPYAAPRITQKKERQ
jgi:hypothetical protein